MKMKLAVMVLALVAGSYRAENKCGQNFADSACGEPCPSGLDSECVNTPGDICIANAPECVADDTFRCGATFEVSGCGISCPTGLDEECSDGEFCFANAPECRQPTEAPTPNLGFGACDIESFQGGCKDSCPGISLPGFCDGLEGDCCVLEPRQNAVFFTAPAPDISQSSGSCTSPQGSLQGECIRESFCTGATFNDVCEGEGEKCCVPEENPVADFLNDPFLIRETKDLFLLDAAKFASFFEGVIGARRDALLPYYNFALARISLDSKNKAESCFRSAAFAAQVGFESNGLQFFESTTTGEENEGLLSLGNTEEGDGVLFKGRGPIQLTGRANYAVAAERLGFDFVFSDPENVCLPSIGFQTTADFWLSNNLNAFAGSNSNAEFERLTQQINGGLNGLVERKERWFKARDELGCDALLAGEESPNDGGSAIGIVAGAVAAVVVLGAVGGAVAYKRYQDEHSFDRKSITDILDNQHNYY